MRSELFTVRALAYLAAGHVTHHLDIVKTRYLESRSHIGL